MKLLALALLSLPVLAPAETLYFTFSGIQETIGIKGVGNGYFSFADGLTTVGLTDLTAFSFMETTDGQGYNPTEPHSYTNNSFNLSDLTAFSLDLTTPYPELNLTTALVPQGAGQDPAHFEVFSDGSTFPNGVVSPVINGPIVFENAPEPATFSLCGLSALLMGLGVWKRSKNLSSGR